MPFSLSPRLRGIHPFQFGKALSISDLTLFFANFPPFRTSPLQFPHLSIFLRPLNEQGTSLLIYLVLQFLFMRVCNFPPRDHCTHFVRLAPEYFTVRGAAKCCCHPLFLLQEMFSYSYSPLFLE